MLVGDWSSESGHELGLELARDPDVTAIFAANDQMALGVLRAMHEAGRAVPGEVSVVGFDDMEESRELLAAAHDGAPVLRRGRRRSVEALLHEVEAGERGGSTLVATELVVRDSTARPSA